MEKYIYPESFASVIQLPTMAESMKFSGRAVLSESFLKTASDTFIPDKILKYASNLEPRPGEGVYVSLQVHLF